MSTLSAVRDGLKSVIATAIPSLRVYDTVPDVTNIPAVVIEPATADYSISMSMDTTWHFDMYVLVSRVDAERGQDLLDSYVAAYGTKSIRQAIFNNPSLGLTDTDAAVQSMRGYGGSFEANALRHIGAIIRVCVTTGTA